MSEHKPDRAENFERIWLGPLCYAVSGEERMWCQDNQGGCDECGEPCVEYIRADLVTVKDAEIVRLRASLRGIVDAWNQCTDGRPPSDYDQSPAFLARRAAEALETGPTVNATFPAPKLFLPRT